MVKCICSMVKPIFDGEIHCPQVLQEDLEGTGELTALEVPTAIRSLGYQATGDRRTLPVLMGGFDRENVELPSGYD